MFLLLFIQPLLLFPKHNAFIFLLDGCKPISMYILPFWPSTRCLRKQILVSQLLLISYKIPTNWLIWNTNIPSIPTAEWTGQIVHFLGCGFLIRRTLLSCTWHSNWQLMLTTRAIVTVWTSILLQSCLRWRNIFSTFSTKMRINLCNYILQYLLNCKNYVR